MEKNMDKVVAITVTYNDAYYLKKCIAALLKQTVPLYKIIIVDNNSNSDNKEILKKVIDDKIEILILYENLGGAGGFEKGMKHAKKIYNPDWYWIMDADAYPREDCLEKLLSHKNDEKNIGFLAPLIYGINLQQYQLYHHKRLTKFLERDIPVYNTYYEVPEISEIEANAFVGPLFSRYAVNKVGVANGALFIYGDDLEYTFRVTRELKALLVKDAVMNHRDQPAANGVQKPQNWWKDYYMYRNRLLFIQKFQNNKILKIIGIWLVAIRCLKQIILSCLLKQNKKLKKYRRKIIKKAYWDGLRENIGKTMDPALFSEEIKKRL